ncbi:primosomal protein N' [Kocuria marina subsp. indica]|uniref:Probable replication restart protein PriA n=1 Tax=Kocuria marina subsp. indica TaxID=1049583 RepID=A0A1X7C592_9MICC|nr:primosomal protein N' [Kocuria indica]RLP59388.1 primosomal protein N' [Kocuria indica]SME90207.1 replication restart DNA helicase PriA [Kocuria indica]
MSPGPAGREPATPESPRPDSVGTAPPDSATAGSAPADQGTVPSDASGEQLALAGLPEAAPPSQPRSSPRKPLGSEGRAAHDPVAKVLLEAYVPHLDRVFDYRVTAALDEQAVVGSKVSVVFAGRKMSGWVVDRVAHTDVPEDRLLPIRRVLTPLPVARPEIVELAQAVAERCAGTVADVLRVAIAPRVARVDKEFAAPEAAETSETGVVNADDDAAVPADLSAGPASDGAADADPTAAPEPGRAPSSPVEPATTGWQHYTGGLEFVASVGRGEPARAVVEVLPSAEDHDWAGLTASAMATAYAAGRGAVGVVADHKALERLERALCELVGEDAVVRLHADDGPTPRYRGFLELALGKKRLAVGTRSAAYAPVQDLALVCCHDDGDVNFVEQRAPYQHTRDVLLLRTQQQGMAALFTGYAVSPEVLRLVATGWAARVAPDRADLRRFSPRIEATSDSYNTALDPLAARARLPHEAFRVAREALKSGPVLVQVARKGYAPVLACQRCRTPARCQACDGSLALDSAHAVPVCTWCGRHAHDWRCVECGFTRVRLSTVGASRTAEELGRSFPQVPVISSSERTVRPRVGSAPALVVATPGAEPVADGGYAAALLLDGNRMLARPWLRAEEQTLRRWFNAAALVRASSDGGTVVVTADQDRAVSALVRWDPAGHAERELRERHELGLPPAVRTAALTGPRDAVDATLRDLALPERVRVVGPAPVEQTPGNGADLAETVTNDAATLDGADAARSSERGGNRPYRALLFFGFGIAPRVTGALRAEKARASALREHAPVTVRCDVADLL